MAGIYIHIPFCKQACYYCDFHFSTSLKKKPEMVEALIKELEIKKDKLKEPIETIYFGGGTPSLLSKEELQRLFSVIYANYTVQKDAEVTLEANPDDLTEAKIRDLSTTHVNRLSIGIQSFFDDNLVWMNRSHNSKQALDAIRFSKRYFDNLTIDLIYGVPGLSDERWQQNLEKALELELPHISSYALTVEPRTALAKMIDLGKKKKVDDATAKRHYEQLIATLEKAGYINYEFSNFGKPGYFSKNNTAYWMGKPYLGIGPSAHGFDGEHRYWNVRNNSLYIKALQKGELPFEMESLTLSDRYNEYVMTRLRTIWGMDPKEMEAQFGSQYLRHFEKEAAPLFKEGLLQKDAKNHIHISKKGKFLGDGISSDLFFIED